MSRLVSVVAVTDPFGAYEPDLLKSVFPDLVVPFKQHLVADLRLPAESFVGAHHRRNIRTSRAHAAVELCSEPALYADDWLALYQELSRRHSIRGPAAFSAKSLRDQLAVPGSVVFRASRESQTVGMVIWYVQGEVAYYHLGAYSPEGYRVKASYAIFAAAIEAFQRLGLHWLSLGAGAGLEEAEDGLTRFKAGWSTGRRTAYLCGRVVDRAAYASLVAARGAFGTRYFPAYRDAELDSL